MQTYSGFQPTGFDSKADFAVFDSEAIDNIQDWLIAPVQRNRDSGVLAESNWAVVLTDLGGEGDNVQIHRFGHWACGWYELMLIRPGTPEAKSAEDWESALADYPIASESDYSERETEAANETWRVCYSDAERIEYMREHRSQFDCLYVTYKEDGTEGRPLADRWLDILANARGRYFGGYASEIVEDSGY